MYSFKQFLLTEGGISGHMAHPYDLVNNGKALINLFEEVVEYIDNSLASVKIDGINASLRVVNNAFVLDRGSTKELDIKGVRPENLVDRFGAGHGFIEKGKKVLQIFDSAFNYVKPELKKLGLLDNENIVLNVEYVEGQTNVINYKGITNFLAIHNLLEVETKINPKNGKIISRSSSTINYDKKILEKLIEKLNVYSKKQNFKVIGEVEVKLRNKPNFSKILSKKITLNEQEKTLQEWLSDLNWTLPLITRKEFIRIFSSDRKNLSEKEITDFIVYYTTISLGDEILNSAYSELGEMSEQEGMVVKRKDNTLFKITGSFILKGLTSKFEEK